MAEDGPRAEGRTLICTVVFVDLVEYSERTVAQQAVQKAHLNRLIAQCLADVAEAERTIIDTGDGAALCFFGDPEDALFAAAPARSRPRSAWASTSARCARSATSTATAA
jgi:class 3 adenylate cyclase